MNFHLPRLFTGSGTVRFNNDPFAGSRRESLRDIGGGGENRKRKIEWNDLSKDSVGVAYCSKWDSIGTAKCAPLSNFSRHLFPSLFPILLFFSFALSFFSSRSCTKVRKKPERNLGRRWVSPSGTRRGGGGVEWGWKFPKAHRHGEKGPRTRAPFS